MTGRWIIAAALVSALATTSQAQESKTTKTASWERYQNLTSNNIFVKDRRPQTSGGSRSSHTPRPESASTERTLVLSGIVQQDGVYIAFVEDTRARTTTKLRIGDALGQGKVAAMTLDAVDYVRDGATVRVEVGKNFEGAAAGTMPSASSDSGSTPGGGSGSAVAPTPGSEAALLERMRQRRLKEMGK